MDFTPLTEEQIKALSLIEPGIYKFQVILCTQKKAVTSGREYFNLKLRILVGDKERIIYDMLFFEGKMLFKTKHFCEAVGLGKNYGEGKLMPYECDYKEGQLEIIQSLNKATGEYESRVKDYVVPIVPLIEPFNDAIPF